MMLIVKSIIYIVKWHLLVGLVLEKVVVDNLLSEMLKLILPQYTFDRLLTIEVILYTFMVDKSQLNLTRLVEWFQRKHKIKTKKLNYKESTTFSPSFAIATTNLSPYCLVYMKCKNRHVDVTLSNYKF